MEILMLINEIKLKRVNLKKGNYFKKEKEIIIKFRESEK
jgi:hypothetical protein